MKQRDTIFKIGLGVQLLLIPVALLWRFSQEANYYYWVIGMSFLIILGLFFWPQTLLGRLKRLSAIKLQLILTSVLLALSWIIYLYFHHYINSYNAVYTSIAPHAYPNSIVIYSINWEVLFHSRWVLALGPGISPSTAIAMTAAILALPLGNLYRYKLDRKRINGIKKEDLFV